MNPAAALLMGVLAVGFIESLRKNFDGNKRELWFAPIGLFV